MSFAKIAEARAVKKIVVLIRAMQRETGVSPGSYAMVVLDDLVDRIEAGEWKDIKLPPAPEKKKAKKR